MSEIKTEVAIIEKESESVSSKAQSLVISDQSSYDLASQLLIMVKATMKKVDEAFDSGIESAHKHHKELLANKKRYYSPLEEAEKILKQKSIAFIREQQRIQEEEQRKAEEAARKAEEKRKAELEEQAKRAEAKGDMAKAEERRAAAEQVVIQPKIVQPAFAQSANTSIKANWKARIVEANKIPANYLLVTDAQKKALQSYLDSLASSTKGTLPIPGVQFYDAGSLAVKI